MWRELSKKGRKFHKPRGLSNDGGYLPPGGSMNDTKCVAYFLELDGLLLQEGLAGVCPRALPSPNSLPINRRNSVTFTWARGGSDAFPGDQTSVPPPPARQLTSTSPGANQVDLTAATPPAAGAKDTSRKPKRAAKATPEDNAAVPQATEHRTQAKCDGS
ncbi:unnamed protein product [Phytophthora fragariaefolia]|uniref:Unnamed protein product n=1 Tax=Phytophthora fragariaefolia TaxID=1490495 RepID=A0A9W6XNU6_9STRA|nr:unnamed protein product [Phytophthora fragariaefolia]